MRSAFIRALLSAQRTEKVLAKPIRARIFLDAEMLLENERAFVDSVHRLAVIFQMLDGGFATRTKVAAIFALEFARLVGRVEMRRGIVFHHVQLVQSSFLFLDAVRILPNLLLSLKLLHQHLMIVDQFGPFANRHTIQNIDAGKRRWPL